MTEKEPLIESIGLREIDPKSLEKNPENPRLVFAEEDLAILRESIRESGILVPLLVYKRKKDGKVVAYGTGGFVGLKMMASYEGEIITVDTQQVAEFIMEGILLSPGA